MPVTKKKSEDELQIARWANANANGQINVEAGIRPIQMCNSDGTGIPLLKLHEFGADIIRFGPKEGVRNHTHEGDHILFVIKGEGFVEYDGTDHVLEPGLCYLIPGHIDHAIKATTELVLIAVGNNHEPLASEARMTPA